MDLILHLGAHRTASTSFQTFIWANRIRLSKRGLTCWTPRRTRNGLLAGMLRHPAMITIEDERKAIRSVGRIRVEMERLARAGQDALLISEENILGSMRNNIADTRLYPLLGERLMRFKPAFEGRRLRIGLCIRSYEDYWTSSLSHLIARGGSVPDIDLLDFLTTQPRRWRHVVRDIAVTLPQAEVVVWPFERMAGRHAAQLDALWGGDCRGLEHGETWRGRSSSLRKLNEIMAMRGEPLVRDGLLDAGARWMPFDEDQRAMLRAEYRRDLAWLKSGAQGLATFSSGRDATTLQPHVGPTLQNKQNSGQTMRAHQPDRADLTRTDAERAVPFRGHRHGIEEGLGRTGAS